METLKKPKKRADEKRKKKRERYPDMPKDPETLAKMVFDVADYKAFGGRKKRRLE